MKNKLLLLSAALLLGACAGGTAINKDGTPAGEIRWPDYRDTQFDHNTGTFPNLENLSKIRPNMSRNQLYDLIGRPHFTEGFHVREWTYVFHFNTPGMGTNGVSTCQYKVLYDTNLRAQSYFWKPIDPVGGFCPPSGKRKGVYTLGADALFAFDRSDLSSITAKGQADLRHLVAELKTFSEINSITVNGYTDRLGSDSYNNQLSKRRAKTVANYLTSQGISAKKVTAVGYGESNQVQACSDNQSRAELVKCLMPNRRVEVLVDGYGVLKK